jgi:hypothetical protein
VFFANVERRSIPLRLRFEGYDVWCLEMRMTSLKSLTNRKLGPKKNDPYTCGMFDFEKKFCWQGV